MSKNNPHTEAETRKAWTKLCEEISFYVRNVHQANKIIQLVGDFSKEYATPDYKIKEWKSEKSKDDLAK